MRHIEVKYQDGTHAFVDDYLLETLIQARQIQQFHRPSERRWISIGIDPTREKTRGYPGRERRRTGHYRDMIPLPAGPDFGDSFSRPSM